MSLSQDDTSHVIGGNTVLMVCASEGDIDNAKLQLTNGADINAKNEQGATALLIAVLNNKPAMVDLLLGYGADAYIASKKGLTPKALATKNGNNEIIQLLDSHSKKDIGNDSFLDGYYSKKEALAKIVNAALVISAGVFGWGIYAYSSSLFSTHPSDISRSVYIAGLATLGAFGYFNRRK